MASQSSIYEYIDKESLLKRMETFFHCTEIQIRLINLEGESIEGFGTSSAYCTRLMKYLGSKKLCQKEHLRGCTIASKLGETFIFSCHGGLYHMIFPLLGNGHHLASILAGPFMMDTCSNYVIEKTAEQYSVSPSDILCLNDAIALLPVIAPTKVTSYGRLLAYLFENHIREDQDILWKIRRQDIQQSQISQSIRLLKQRGANSSYPYELEHKLFICLRTNQKKEAIAHANELLAYFLYQMGYEFNHLKIRVIELVSLMFRLLQSTNSLLTATAERSQHYIQAIEESSSNEEICLLILEAIDNWFLLASHSSQQASHPSLKKSLDYLHSNYSKNLTLTEVAAYVHLNPNYLSTLFCSQLGLSFREYLSNIRIEASKLLLKNSNLGILEIALAVGFESQSYYSKVFKRKTGFSPKVYRSQKEQPDFPDFDSRHDMDFPYFSI